jgi:DDE superfamily endonuclease
LAPTLTDAVRAASTKAFVLLDGTLLPIERTAADRPFYSGKHKRHGRNVQVLTDPFGRLLWASPALPGAIHDIRAAREDGIIDALTQADITCWATRATEAPAAQFASRTVDDGKPSPTA